MAEEALANSEHVVSPPDEITQAPEAEQTTDDNAAPESEETQEQSEEDKAPVVEDDSEEVEWEGKSFKAPKGIKESLLRQADYTKKTMALAEQQKAWTAEKQATEAFTREVGQVMHMNDQIAQYEKIDWQSWYQSDPKAAEAARFNYGILRENRDNLARGLDAKVQERNAQAEREYASRVEQETAALSKPDPERGWAGKFTPELKSKLDNFARSIGYTEEALSRVNANDVKTLHLAMLGQEYLKQQRAAAKPQTTEAKPIPMVKGGRGSGPGNTPPTDMEAYAAWRKRGGGK